MEQVRETPLLPQPNAGPHGGFIASLITVLRDVFERHARRSNGLLPKDGSEGLTAYTDTPDTKPSASANPGALIYVSDGGAGGKFRGSDGTSWVNLG